MNSGVRAAATTAALLLIVLVGGCGGKSGTDDNPVQRGPGAGAAGVAAAHRGHASAAHLRECWVSPALVDAWVGRGSPPPACVLRHDLAAGPR